jgi:hypothetical protein
MHTRHHVKYRFICHILIQLEFFEQIFKNIQIWNFMKIRPAGAELFHADRQTWR